MVLFICRDFVLKYLYRRLQLLNGISQEELNVLIDTCQNLVKSSAKNSSVTKSNKCDQIQYSPLYFKI